MWNDIVAAWDGASALVRLIRIGLAVVWIMFGVLFKVANLVPRHEQIVARVVGERAARLAVVAIGLAEASMGLWILSGLYPVASMALMTGAILAMNAIELRLAHDLLLAPRAMVAGNAILVAAGWWAALQ
jgi:uncharacterized membrane protein YphA (DoxX/SURF4 family)